MILDLFGGPGGTAEGLRSLGLSEVGIEIDRWACATRAAAGHATIQADVAAYPTEPFRGRVEGLCASPPCQAWSAAGKRQGEVDRAACHELAERMARGDDSTTWRSWADARSPLVCEPVRWVRDLRPRWVALEQVPPVMGLWEHFAHIFRGWGYSAWTGVLCAADYGVPQTRERAILMASLDRPAVPPAATHCRGGSSGDLFGPGLLPWVSMADALGWDEAWSVRQMRGQGMLDRHGDRPDRQASEPAPTVRANGGSNASPGWELRRTDDRVICGNRAPRWAYPGNETTGWTLRSGQSVNGRERAERSLDEPAVTVTSNADDCRWVLSVNARENATERDLREPAPALTVGHSSAEMRIGRPGHKDRDQGEAQFAEQSVRVSIEEAAILQSFRPDYPFQGTKTARFAQVGNAVPPRLAAAVIGTLRPAP